MGANPYNIGMNSFWLKIVAIISMFADHLSYALPQRVPALNAVGRIAFPLFAFQIAQGCRYTRNFNAFALRLAVFAIISQYPFSLLMRMTGGAQTTLNIFFTLFIGVMLIRAYMLIPCKPAAVIAVVLGACVADLIKTDYGAWGVLLIFLLFLAGDNKLHQVLAVLFMAVIKYSNTFVVSGVIQANPVAFLTSILFIMMFNGQKGASLKYAFYVFYPAHLLLLYALNQFVF